MQDTDEAARRKNAARSRDRRFRTHFQRWLRGEPIRTYDTRWLAYLEEQLSSADMKLRFASRAGRPPTDRPPAAAVRAESSARAASHRSYDMNGKVEALFETIG